MKTINSLDEFYQLYPPVPLPNLHANLIERADIGRYKLDVPPNLIRAKNAFALPPETHKDLMMVLDKEIFSTLFIAGAGISVSEVTPRPLVVEDSLGVNCRDGVVCVIGDLTIIGDLDFSSPLVVVGNVVVEGMITGTEPRSDLVVTGNVTAQHMHVEGSNLIGGDLTLAGYLYGYYNDGMTQICGRLKARCAIGDDYGFFYDASKAEYEAKPVQKKFADFYPQEMTDEDFKHIKTVVPEGAVYWDPDYAQYRVDSEKLFT